MKITDDFKKRLEAAKTKEEAEAILAEINEAAEQTGIELDLEDLQNVAGGGAYGELRGEIGNWHFV